MGKRGLPSDHIDDEARNLSPMPETETGNSEITGYSLEISGGTNDTASASAIAEQDQHTLQQQKDMEIDNAEINNANHATSLHDNKNTILDDDVDPQLEKNLHTLKALKRTFLEQSESESTPKIETKENISNIVIESNADAMEEDSFNNFGDETGLSEDQEMQGPTVIVNTQEEPREAWITQTQTSQDHETCQNDEKMKEITEEVIVSEKPRNLFRESLLSSISNEDNNNSASKPDCNSGIRKYPDNGYYTPSEISSVTIEEPKEDSTQKSDSSSNNLKYPEISEISEDHDEPKIDDVKQDSSNTRKDSNEEINWSTRFHRPGASFYESFKKDKKNKESLSKEAHKESKEVHKESMESQESSKKSLSSNKINENTNNNKKISEKDNNISKEKVSSKKDNANNIEQKKQEKDKQSVPYGSAVKDKAKSDNIRKNTEKSENSSAAAEQEKSVKSNSSEDNCKETCDNINTGFINGKFIRNSPKPKPKQVKEKSQRNKLKSKSSKSSNNNSEDISQDSNQKENFTVQFPLGLVFPEPKISATEEIQNDVQDQLFKMRVQGQPNVEEEENKFSKEVIPDSTNKESNPYSTTTTMKDIDLEMSTALVAGAASDDVRIQLTANENETKNASCMGEEKKSNSELDSTSSQVLAATNDYSSSTNLAFEPIASKASPLSKNASSSSSSISTARSVQGQPNVGDDDKDKRGKLEREKVFLDKSSFDLECPILKQQQQQLHHVEQSTRVSEQQGGEHVQAFETTLTTDTIRNGPTIEEEEAVVNHASKNATDDLNHDKNQDVFQDQDHLQTTNSSNITNGSNLKKSSSFVQAENWVRERYTNNKNENDSTSSISRKIAKDWVKNDNVEDNIVIKDEHTNSSSISRKNTKSAEQHWLEKDLMTETEVSNENSREIKNEENNRSPLSPARDFSSTSSIPSRFKNMLGSTSGSGTSGANNFRENATPRRGSIFERQNSNSIANSNSISRKNSISSTTTTPFSSRTTSPEPPTTSVSGKPYFNSAKMATMVSKPPTSFQRSQSTFHLSNGVENFRENQESKFEELKRSESQSTYQINQLKDLLQKDSIKNSEIRNSVKNNNNSEISNLTKNAENNSPYNRSKSWHTDSTSNTNSQQAFTTTKSRETEKNSSTNPRIQIHETGTGNRKQSPIREFSPIVLVRPSTFIKAMTPTPERRFNTKSKASDKLKDTYPDPPVDTRDNTRPGLGNSSRSGTENDKVPSRFRRAMQHSSSNTSSSNSTTSGSTGNAGSSGMTRSRSIHELHEASLGAKANNLQEQIRQARADHLRAYDDAQSHTRYNVDSNSGYVKPSERARRGSPVRRTPSTRANEVTQAFQALGRMRNVRASSASNY